MATLKEIDFDPFAGAASVTEKPAFDRAGALAQTDKILSLPAGFSAAQIQVESGGNPKARSPAGAMGLAQVMPKTLATLSTRMGRKLDPDNESDAIDIHREVMRENLAKFKDTDKALKAYNGGWDPAKWDNPETSAYVGKVQAAMKGQQNPVMAAVGKAVNAVMPSAQAEQPAPRNATLKEVDFDPFAQTAPGAAPAASSPKRSMIEDLGRQLGLTVRAGVNGVAAIPAMAADAVTGPINAGLDAVAGKGEGFRFKSAGRSVNDLMTSAGLPLPEDAQERVIQDAASAVAGAGGMIKGGMGLVSYAKGPVTQAVGKMLSAGPGLQLASAAAGAGASGVTRESGGSAGAQMAAGLAGGLAPGLVAPAMQSLARGALRGGEAGRQRIAKNLEAFEAAGVSPTLGQVAGGKLQKVESILGKTPGGAGIVASYADKQADDMAASVQRLSDELAPGANAMNAGEAISRGINSFKQGIKATQQKLYANLDTHIPAGTPITSDRTRAALADLNSDIAGAPELSKWFKNARIQGIEGGLKTDTTSLDAVLSRPGMRQQVTQMQSHLEAEAARATAVNAERRMLGMNNMEPVLSPAQIKDQIDGFLTKQVDSRLPYESIKKLRTLVGRELADGSLVADVPRSKWTALYSALSDDLGVAAKNAGPEAEKSWNWANQFTKGQLGRLEQLSSIVAKDSPEKIFGAAIAGTLEGDTVIKRVISALPKQERREVAAAVLQRMGRATAGQQNAMGDAFSSETFLTNLSKLSPASRRTLFGRTDVKGIEAQVEQFAKVSDFRRASGKVFANPSGTAATGAQLVNAAAIGSGITASVASGNPLPLAGVLAGPAIANVGARFMTSPNVVKKLAQSTVLPEGSRAAAVGAATRINSTSQPVGELPREAQLKEVDFDPFAESAPSVAPAYTQQAAEPVDPVRIELNGMAHGAGADPTSAPQDPRNDLETDTPDAIQGNAEADPAQAFTSVQRPDGTLAIGGDPQALHAMLIASGIPARSIVRNAAGVMVGRSQAGRVQEAIARMRQPDPESGQAPGDAIAPENVQSDQVYADSAQPDAQNMAPDAEKPDLNALTAQAVEAPDQSQLALAAPTPGDVPAVPTLEPEQNQALAQVEPVQSAIENVAPEAGQTIQTAQAAPAAEPVHPMVARIQRLKDAGEDQVAKMLQRNHDSEQTLSAVQTELAGMRESAPDLPHHQNAHFQAAYQQQRTGGAKPAEAAARAGILAAVQETAPGAGMPEKAVAALQEKLDRMPVDEAPGFVQRFTQSLIAKGYMPTFQGADQIEQMLTRARDGSMNAMVDSAYQPKVG